MSEFKYNIFKKLFSKKNDAQDLTKDEESKKSIRKDEEFQKKLTAARREVEKYIAKKEYRVVERLCNSEILKDDPQMQLELIAILKKQSRANDAEKIMTRDIFQNDDRIQSAYATRLMETNRRNQAIEIYNNPKFINSEIIQLQYVNYLIKENLLENLEKIRAICRRDVFQNSPNIQDKYLNVLISTGQIDDIDEAMKICEKKEFGENPVVQNVYIKILLDKKELEEVEKITSREKFFNEIKIQLPYISYLIEEGTEESLNKAEEICRREKISGTKVIKSKVREIEKKRELLLKVENNESQKKGKFSKKTMKFCNYIKTKLYYDKLEKADIQKLTDEDNGLTDWQKDIILIAVYSKLKMKSVTEEYLKDSKNKYSSDLEKMKLLNKISNEISNKKQKAFNWKTFDSILGWKIDAYVYNDLLKKEREEINYETQSNKSAEKNKEQNSEKINITIDGIHSIDVKAKNNEEVMQSDITEKQVNINSQIKLKKVSQAVKNKPKKNKLERDEKQNLRSESKNYKEIIKKYEKGIQENPKDINKRNILAFIYYKNGQIEKSEQLLTKTIKEFSSYTAYREMVYLQKEQEKLDDAKLWAYEGIEKYPDSIDLRLQLISIAKKENDAEEIKNMENQINQINPTILEPKIYDRGR